MAQRPIFISMPSGSTTPGMNSPSSALPSPRMQRIAGEVAPAMSPLDVFAAQSRALARKLDEERKNDRRVSRLPPIAVVDVLARRPELNSGPQSAGSRGSLQRDAFALSPEEPSGNRMEIETPVFRPKSFYPRLSKVVAAPDVESPQRRSHFEHDKLSTPMEYSTVPDYFGSARTRSPEPSAPVGPSMEPISQHSSQTSLSRPKNSFDSVTRTTALSRGLSIESSSSRVSQYSNSLQPPNPPYARRTSSIRSVSSDEEDPGITPSSSFSQQRKLSSSSNVSLPLSPQFSYSHSHNRSTSQLSEYSVNGNRLSKPAYNFSRPLSRGSRPSMDSPRMSSFESHTRTYEEDGLQTPVSVDNVMSGESEGSREGETAEGNSYIYAKYSLPRGRMVGRDSIPLDHIMLKVERDQPQVESNVKPIHPKTRPKDVVASLLTPPSSVESDRPRVSTDSLPLRPPPMPALKDNHRHSMTSMNTHDSGSTIKANKRPNSTELTAEDHLTKGIECHEKGSLNESTYHFRLAARQNNPTAMLLYALACRHGWGMRASPAEGVTWLRKAMDCASIEMSLDEEEGRSGDAEGRKKRRAQFALSVYELGVSHMNGWGIEQDKFLALRCFEIASNWGDADAMAEAGFCFAQGVGCKKDLKKAAKYYREAESRGMSMVGNSWIYKSKYDTEPEERTGRSSGKDGDQGDKKDKKDKKRDKSRTRSIFNRKKLTAA